ncbi:MAG: hypothetical protein HW418_3651 [Anaerolineales bacterium]|jgi:hypothetical protein|nr:hypothetical protein [Anaerolineales bacterium]
MDTVAFLKPAMHGASGYWDEVLNFFPLALGVALLIYLYLASRKQRPPEEPPQDDEAGRPSQA